MRNNLKIINQKYSLHHSAHLSSGCCNKLTPGLSDRCKAKVQTHSVLISGCWDSPQGPAQICWCAGLGIAGRKSKKCWGGFKPHVILPSKPKTTRMYSAHTSSSPCFQAHEVCDRWVSHWCLRADFSISYCTSDPLSLSQSFHVRDLPGTLLLSPTWSFSALSCILLSHTPAYLWIRSSQSIILINRHFNSKSCCCLQSWVNMWHSWINTWGIASLRFIPWTVSWESALGLQETFGIRCVHCSLRGVHTYCRETRWEQQKWPHA